MEIEEIKCPLCAEFYDENEKVPLLLPECGHSFCLKCIINEFEQVKDQQNIYDTSFHKTVESIKDGRNYKSEDPMTIITPEKSIAMFKCPEDK